MLRDEPGCCWCIALENIGDDMKLWLKWELDIGEGREGEDIPGGVGELLNEGALDPGGVIDPIGEVENMFELCISAGGEPKYKNKVNGGFMEAVILLHSIVLLHSNFVYCVIFFYSILCCCCSFH